MSLISRKALSLSLSRAHAYTIGCPGARQRWRFSAVKRTTFLSSGTLLTNERSGGGYTRGRLVKRVYLKVIATKQRCLFGLAFARITWPTLLQRGLLFRPGRVAKVALITGLTRARRNARKTHVSE